MRLLSDYAIIHDVFEADSHNPPQLADTRFQHLKEILLVEALVRDLRNAQWTPARLTILHRRAKELMVKMIQQGRIIKVEPQRPTEPDTHEDWCNEAIASHQSTPLNGIITMQATASLFATAQEKDLIGAMENLHNVKWWQSRSSSVRLNRKIVEYLSHLELILKNAKSLMFIDPHLDPSQRRYGEFIRLLEASAGNRKTPRIEIHRVCYEGPVSSRSFPDWEQIFRDKLEAPLKTIGLTVNVFIWDDFHDRYLITNLIGISIPNGFDVSRNRDALTTWCRLGRNERDDIQREFDENAKRHKLHNQFSIP